MKKRFKPGARVELTEGEALQAVTPLMSEVISEHGHDACRLTAEDIRRIQAADLLEDGLYEDAARRLGIKPEGE